MPTFYRTPGIPLVVLLGWVGVSLSLCLAAHAQRKPLELDDIEKGAFYGNLPEVQQWSKDRVHYLAYGADSRGNFGLLRVDARTGDGEPLADTGKVALALIAAGADRSAAGNAADAPRLILDRDEKQLLFTIRNDLYTYDLAENRAVRLTVTPGSEKEDPTFSPDGKQIAYTRDHDLYVVETGHPGAERRLTRDGSNRVLNGVLDWVYEEEVYGRGHTRGFEWSPDSRRLAFLRIDDSPVRAYPIIDHLPRPQKTEKWDYPLAGDPNPVVTLGVAAVDGATPARFLDLDRYPSADRLLVRFGWMPGGRRLTFQVQPRNATFLDLNVGDPETGKITTLFREKTPAWVEIIGNPLFLADGSFLWLSDRTGYRHLYRYRGDGTLAGAVTRGDWDVRSVCGLDSREEFVYFTASEHSPVADHAYRIAARGNGAPERLTPTEGNHDVLFSPDCALFIDTCSSAAEPPDLRLRDGNKGAEVRLIAGNDEAKQAVAAYRFSRPELLQVKARDGFLLEARITRPPDFDSKKKYPVWMEVYGGPGTQTVRDQWEWPLWRQLVAQRGVIVWECDNRSASGKGVKSAWTVYRGFGSGELADIEDSLTYLKTLPYVDAGRIGISGASFGGFLTEFALTHSQSFKCGFAVSAVSDWRLYDSIYTERYMNTPLANVAGYRAASPVESAARCHGKLFLVHGMMDDNVHLQNTISLVYELQRNEKEFGMMLYPSVASRHDINDPALARHLRRLTLRFIEDNL